MVLRHLFSRCSSCELFNCAREREREGGRERDRESGFGQMRQRDSVSSRDRKRKEKEKGGVGVVRGAGRRGGGEDFFFHASRLHNNNDITLKTLTDPSVAQSCFPWRLTDAIVCLELTPLAGDSQRGRGRKEWPSRLPHLSITAHRFPG